MTKTVLFTIFMLFAPSLALASGNSIVRLDAKMPAELKLWFLHETEAGFSSGMIISSHGWAEIDAGWAFHPADWLTVATFASLQFDSHEAVAVMPFVVGVLHTGDWYGEVWPAFHIDLKDSSKSFVYLDQFITYHGFGPFARLLIQEEVEASLGGIFVHRFDFLEVQASVGAQDIKHGGVVCLLSLLYFL